MNRLILLGNGFDLAHVLKTGYNDFIRWYFKKCLMSAVHHAPFEDAMLRVEKIDYYFAQSSGTISCAHHDTGHALRCNVPINR